LSNCSVVDQTVECSFNEIETIGANWNTSNISNLENCTQTFDITVTSDYDFNNLEAACGQTGSIDVIYTLTDLCGNATVFEATFTIEDNTPPVFDGADDDVCVAGVDNGSFEANTFDGSFIQFQQEDVPGWSTTASHNTIEIQRSGQIDGSIPFDGNYHMELNGRALDDLYQEFCTVPLSNLELSFYHKKRASSTAVDVLEVFIGPDLNNLTSQGVYQVSDAEGWKQNIILYPVPAGQDATIILFQAISGTTNSIGNLLDAITVNSDVNNNGPLPEDITVECNEIPNAPNLTASDDCGTANVSLIETIIPGSCTNQYTIERTWTATDECGNNISHTQNINVEDTTAPGFTQNPPSDTTVECSNIPNAPTLFADDNCGSAVVTFEEVATGGTCLAIETIVRTWIATDECGNTNVHVQTITVQDTTAPVAPEAPADIILQCTDNLPTPVELVAADNCSGDITATPVVTVDDSDACNTITTLTWTFIDDCGNESQISQTITITDTMMPTFTVPADIALECGTDASDLSITGDVFDEDDNCSDNLEAIFIDTITEGTCANETIISRSWSLSDDCDNTTTLVQTITIQDTIAPTFTVPADISLECDVDANDLSITGEVTDQADNCSANLEVTFTDTTTNGSCSNEFITTRVWTVTDDCGNASALVQTITIQDTTAPTFTVPADVTLECDVDITDISLTGDVTDETDNCSTDLQATFSDTVASGDCPNNSIITRTWTLVDECSNIVEAIQTITVTDTTAPTLVGELEEVINIECSDIPEIPELIFEDACSTTDMTVNFNETSTADGTITDYVITREWFVMDDCGNEAIYIQTINVSVGSEISVDDDNLCITEDFEFDLFDLLIGDYDPDGVWEVTSGNATIDGSFFNPSSLLDDNDDYTQDQIREYEFTYTYGGSCPGDATVTININDDCVVLPCGQDDLVISKAVTANGDGVNDVFTITGTESCGFVYELLIFNRWGSKIYDNSNYQNDWNGTASSGSIGNSEFVPTGTYYYVLNIKNSGLKPVTGPIYVSTK
jgi:gliding motility-associated-like protein